MTVERFQGKNVFKYQAMTKSATFSNRRRCDAYDVAKAHTMFERACALNDPKSDGCCDANRFEREGAIETPQLFLLDTTRWKTSSYLLFSVMNVLCYPMWFYRRVMRNITPKLIFPQSLAYKRQCPQNPFPSEEC